MKRTIVITDWGFPSLEPEQAVFSNEDIDLKAHQCKTEDEVASVSADADVVMVQWAPVKRKALEAMRKCRGIVRYGIGLDNIDLATARERGIPVRNVPDYCLHEVADHTLGLLLALQRQVVRVFDLVKAGTWKITPPLQLPPLRDCTLGLVGFGRIAQLVAERARGFGTRIVASDPFIADDVFRKAGVEKVPSAELIQRADLISLHCPLTEETRHVINASSLANMKPTALLVNTGRGGLIDTDALATVLGERRIAGAALDVLEQEPIPSDHALLKLDNVIITSHISWYSSASIKELQRKAALAALELLGKPS